MDNKFHFLSLIMTQRFNDIKLFTWKLNKEMNIVGKNSVEETLN